MLTGFFKSYGHTLYLTGADVNNTIILMGYTDSLKDRLFFDGGWLSPDGHENPLWNSEWVRGEESIYLSIGLSNISVEKFVHEDSPSEINKDVFSQLGSIIRGMKVSCNKENRADYYDMDFNTFDPKRVLDFVIPNKGTISLNMGELHDLEYSVGSTELVLHEDDSVYTLGYKPSMTTIKLKLDDFYIQQPGELLPSEGSFFSLDEIIKNNPTKNFDWLYGRDYSIIGKKDLPGLKKKLLQHDGVIAFDTETTGLNMNFKSAFGEGDQLVGLVFSVKEGEAFYVPLRHRYIENVCEEWEIQQTLDSFFKEVLETKDLVAHNSSFDWKTMWVHQINCNIVHDTLALYQLSLVNAGDLERVGLKYVSNALLNRDSLELSDFVGGSWGAGDLDFRDLYAEGVRLYACADTDNTLGIFNYALRNNLFEKYKIEKVYQIECLFSLCIGYQEFYGLSVDIERAEDLGIEIRQIMDDTAKQIFTLVGHDFNLASPVQIQKVFFEELGYPVLELTDSGKPSTGKRVLKRLSEDKNEDGSLKYPVAGLLKQYKEAETLNKNFIKKLPDTATEDGFMFSSVNQYLETGRLSVKDPNYQSFDSTIKKYIIPRPGFYMMDTDYSAVEYRVLANMSKEERLIKAFYDPDTDYHSFQASRMFNVPEELVTPQLRQQSKGVNFGLPYGLGDRGLGAHIFGEASDENTQKAALLRKKYFEGQDNVRSFFERNRQGGVDAGYATTAFGRRRYFDRRFVKDDRIRRQAGNHAIQGTAADLYKIAMGRLFHRIAKRGYLGKVLMSAFVHDELVMEVHNSIDPVKMLADLKWAMEITLPEWAPLMIGVGYGRNWYEAKSTELPVLLQNEMVDSWKETGVDWWNGDQDKLYEWELKLIEDHEKKRVVDWINDSENAGGTVKVAILSLARSVLKREGLKEFGETPVDTLRLFAETFDMVPVFESLHLTVPKAVTQVETVSFEEVEDIRSEEEDLALFRSKAEAFGFAVDYQKNLVLINSDKTLNFPEAALRLVDLLNSGSGEFRVQLIKHAELKNTNYSLSTQEISRVREIFLALSGISS